MEGGCDLVERAHGRHEPCVGGRTAVTRDDCVGGRHVRRLPTLCPFCRAWARSSRTYNGRDGTVNPGSLRTRELRARLTDSIVRAMCRRLVHRRPHMPRTQEDGRSPRVNRQDE